MNVPFFISSCEFHIYNELNISLKDVKIITLVLGFNTGRYNREGQDHLGGTGHVMLHNSLPNRPENMAFIA